MSLTGTLNIGTSALAVQQAAIQVTGNNIANAGNADYTRQIADITPGNDQKIGGIFLGEGVNLDSVSRQIDDALEDRLRGSISDNQAAQSNQQWLDQVQSTFNELGDNDLSTQLSTFFGGWSDLANNPQAIGQRQVVLQDGQNVATWFNGLNGQLGQLQQGVDDRLQDTTRQADSLASQIATLNSQISAAEGGSPGVANGLRDQRDAVIKNLSQLMDVTTVQQGSITNVYVGSEPLVMGTTSQGLQLKTGQVNGLPTASVIFKANGGTVTIKSGEIGGLQQVRSKVGDVMNQVSGLAGNLIFELNKLHASGQGLEGFSSTTATSTVDDPTVALNNPKSGLAHPPTNGSFVVHVTDKTTGLSTSTLVQVDLDGVGGNDTTLNSLQAALGAINGVNANISAGKLTIASTNPNTQISFSQDSSGALASLGLNSFYTGSNARDIAVNQALLDRPQLLAAAKNGDSGDNQTARAIASLESQPIAGLNGSSLKDSYQAMVNGVAVAADAAKTNAQATQAASDTLIAQRESLSGVSLDEEAVKLMQQQRAFQGAARLITTVNSMMDEVLNLVR